MSHRDYDGDDADTSAGGGNNDDDVVDCDVDDGDHRDGDVAARLA